MTQCPQILKIAKKIKEENVIMLVSLLLCFLAATESKSIKNSQTASETNPLKYIKSSIDFIKSLLRSLQENVQLKISGILDPPTSEPPDFFEGYTMEYIAMNTTTPWSTSPAINWYQTNRPTEQLDSYTSHIHSTPKFPSRPNYTLDEPSTTKPRPTDFWDQLFGTGVMDSEGNITELCLENCNNTNTNPARIVKIGQRYSQNTPSIRSSLRQIYIRSTGNNYERDWGIPATNPRPHQFKWSWGGMQAVFEAS